MILGITGKNASGKGEVTSYLKSKGFIYYSLSDILREEATKRNIEHTRDNLINLGNELREKYGANFLAQQINNKIEQQLKKNKNQNFAVDSIRSPFEIEELRKNKKFVLFGIDAPIELRFERMKSRGRLGDAKTVGQLKEQEQKENLKKDSNQQLDKCLSLADYTIVNEDTLEELHQKIDNLILSLKR